MALAVGARLGSCEVLGRIGAGGMGEVFRARDLKLGREVALKALPDAVARDPERRARFEREARLLASLSHPHIAAIHDLLETDDGVPVLLLELVEGETLDARIARGSLPLKQALTLGGQIAEAIEAAHERGILHRDLKPSNVKLTREGKAKLLDFGLAKALDGGEGELPGGALASSAATLTSPADATAAGAVLGTAPYMSPEQARGEPLDRRTDVWSFGCVLYEMLSGRRAFEGTTRTEAIAAVLERDPDWGALPEGTPAMVLALLRRCLRKEKDERLRDMGDARIELKEACEALSSGPISAVTGPAGATTAAAAGARRRAWPRWVGGVLVVGLAAGLGWAVRPRLLRTYTPTRLTLSPPGDISLPGAFSVPGQHLAVAPDGRRVAFVGVSARGRAVYLREIDEIEAEMIPDTDGATTPFFSPDGRWLGFAHGTRLMRVPVGGGSPMAIGDIPGEAGSPGEARYMRGASWGPDGTIVFSPEIEQGLWRVPAAGGTARPLTTVDRQKREASHRWPQLLPDGRAALFTITSPSSLARDARLAVVSLETGQYRAILDGTGFARYCPTGHVLYAKVGSVLAVPFDLSRLAVTGPPAAVLSDVQMALVGHSYADVDVSASGTLVYVPGAPRLVESSLLRVDREGRTEALTRTRRSWVAPRLSPNGRRLAVVANSDVAESDVWLLDLDRDALERVSRGGLGDSPAWSPDGQRLAFTVGVSDALVMTAPVDGSGPPEPATEAPPGVSNLDEWSPDGRLLVFSQQNPGRVWDIVARSLGAGGPPSLLLANSFIECCAALSPDGRWMAYVSDETGGYEVYVRPFPALGEKRRVSTQGGIQPLWSRDGRELFYRTTGDRPKVMAVTVQVRGGLRFGLPKALLDDVFDVYTPFRRANYDVAPDGRFVFVEKPPERPAPRQIVLIPDFARELEQRLRAAGQ